MHATTIPSQLQAAPMTACLDLTAASQPALSAREATWL